MKESKFSVFFGCSKSICETHEFSALASPQHSFDSEKFAIIIFFTIVGMVFNKFLKSIVDLSARHERDLRIDARRPQKTPTQKQDKTSLFHELLPFFPSLAYRQGHCSVFSNFRQRCFSITSKSLPPRSPYTVPDGVVVETLYVPSAKGRNWMEEEKSPTAGIWSVVEGGVSTAKPLVAAVSGSSKKALETT